MATASITAGDSPQPSFLESVFQRMRARFGGSVPKSTGKNLVEVAADLKEASAAVVKKSCGMVASPPVAFTGGDVQPQAAGGDPRPPSSPSLMPPSSPAGAPSSVSGNAPAAGQEDDDGPGFTAEHAAGIEARLHTFTQAELQTALDLVPQSYQKLRWDIAARLNSGEGPTSNGDLASMTHAELEAALAATPASDNARRYEIAERLSAGAPMVPAAELAGLSADEIRERLQAATDNRERWDLAKALERADSLEGMTAEQLEAGLASAKTPMERGRYAFAIAALNS